MSIGDLYSNYRDMWKNSEEIENTQRKLAKAKNALVFNQTSIYIYIYIYIYNIYIPGPVSAIDWWSLAAGHVSDRQPPAAVAALTLYSGWLSPVRDDSSTTQPPFSSTTSQSSENGQSPGRSTTSPGTRSPDDFSRAAGRAPTNRSSVLDHCS